jgi:DNA primase
VDDPARQPPPRSQAPGQQQPRTLPGADGPERKLAALREQLLAVAAAVRTSEDWGRTLQAAARLPGESFANILLIEAQRPGTTVVKGYEEWRAAGRQVTKGEPGIEVFSASPRHPAGPSRDTRSKREPEPPPPGWRDARRVAYVWDISQTSGPPAAAQAALPGTAGEVPARLWDALSWLARREGFAVEHEHGAPADGVTFWTPRRIRVLPGLDPGPTAWALAHQLGHVIMHGDIPRQPGATTSGDACTATPKAEADALAYITLTRYGITVPHPLASPATWAGTDPRAQPAATILAAGQRITTAATRVTRHLDTTLPGTAPAPAPTVAVRQPATRPAPRHPPRQRPPDAAGTRPPPRPATEQAVPDARLIAILRAAGTFYSSRLAGSWSPPTFTPAGSARRQPRNGRSAMRPLFGPR